MAASDDTWGEHEIDYILTIQADVDLNVNANEVSQVVYVDPDEVRHMLQEAREGREKVTPWFALICDKFLFGWWEQLGQIETMQNEIHRL
jgi:isopentenyl-diphosphate delta-isomerase